MKDRMIDQLKTDINITGVAENLTWWSVIVGPKASNFGYRKSITIDHTKINADLTNFPVLVDITDSDLQNNVLQAKGNDIAFVNSDHTVQYNHEIELYNSTNGHLVAWVNVTLVSSTIDTTFYIYYGNSTCANQENKQDVWDSNYLMVQHLQEDGTGTRSDSTSNGNDGTPTNYDGDEATSSGKINGADNLDGTNDWINISSGTELLNLSSSSGSFFTWIKTSTSEKTVMSKSTDDEIGQPGDILLKISANKLFLFVEGGSGIGGTDLTGTTSVTDNTWHYVGFTYNKITETFNLYVDGQLENTSSYSMNGYNTWPVALGVFSFHIPVPEDWFHFDGTIDEVCISNIERNVSWINASYQNQNAPSTFLRTGDQESENQVYFNITVKNTGSITLETTYFSILINGTEYQFTCPHIYLSPRGEVVFTTSTTLTRGEKRVKVISDNGISGYYKYNG